MCNFSVLFVPFYPTCSSSAEHAPCSPCVSGVWGVCCVFDRPRINACFTGQWTEYLCQGQADRMHYGKVIHEFTIECIYTLTEVCRVRNNLLCLKDCSYWAISSNCNNTCCACLRVCAWVCVDGRVRMCACLWMLWHLLQCLINYLIQLVHIVTGVGNVFRIRKTGEGGLEEG